MIAKSIGIGEYGSNEIFGLITNGILDGLKQENFVCGENLDVDIQNANYKQDTCNLIADRFVAEKLDLTFSITTPITQSFLYKLDNANIPVVFTGVMNPVESGLIVGEITGVSDQVSAREKLEMIRKILPNAKRIGIICTTSEPNTMISVSQVKVISEQYGFEVVAKGIRHVSDIPLAINSIINDVDLFLNCNDINVMSAMRTFLEKTNTRKIPVFDTIGSDQVKLGCIASVGVNYYELAVQTGKMGARILKGEAKASKIPFEYPNKKEIYINSGVFEFLGIELADEMKIEAIDVNKI